MKTTKTGRNTERGQSMIELAFSMVILMIMAAGAMDLGRAFFTYMALRDAAQEGAVFASICPNNLARVEARVRASSDRPVNLSDTTNVQITCTQEWSGGTRNCGVAGVPGYGVKVKVTYGDFRISMPFLGAILGRQHMTLGAEATDTILRETCMN